MTNKSICDEIVQKQKQQELRNALKLNEQVRLNKFKQPGDSK